MYLRMKFSSETFEVPIELHEKRRTFMANDNETLNLFYEEAGLSRDIGQITELLYNKFVILYLKEV